MTEENPGTNPEPSPLPQSTILIVDDNAQNVELLQAFLESLPVKIVTAIDGIDALEKVKEHNPESGLGGWRGLERPREQDQGLVQAVFGG